MHLPRAARLAVALAATLAALPASASAATLAGTVDGTPDSSCGSDLCTVAGHATTVSGVIVEWSVRYAGAATGDTAAFKVLSGASNPTVLHSTAHQGLAGGSGTLSFALNQGGKGIPITAGQRIGIAVNNASLGAPPKVIASAGTTGFSEVSGDFAVGEGGSAFWAHLTGGDLQVRARIEPDADGDGYGDETQDATPPPPPGTGTDGSTGGGGGTGGGAKICRAATAAAAARVASPATAPSGPPLAVSGPATARTAARRWRAAVLDRSRPYLEGRVAFDARGRRHVIGHRTNPSDITYFGPAGARTVGPAAFAGDMAITFEGGTLPVVSYTTLHTEYDDAGPGLVGLSRSCDVLWVARGGAFQPTVFAATPENGRGYQFHDIAAGGGALHAAYGYGQVGRLMYHRAGQAAQSLPLTDVKSVRIAAVRDVVAVAASAPGRLVVFTRRGAGAWKALVLARGVGSFGSWDMALGSDGRPRLAFRDRRQKLALFNGRRPVKTRLPADQVALALARGNALRVAFTKTGGPNCFGWIRRSTCISNGLFHLAANAAATRGRIETVQRSIGESPALSIAASGRRVAIAYPGWSSRLTVRTR